MQTSVPDARDTALPGRVRGFMLDSARCLEVRDYYRRFIDFVADRGINLLLWHFTDDQGCAMCFDAAPEAASKHAYSKPEMRALVAYARGRGIQVVPEIATLGHSRYLTRLPAFRHLDEAGGDAVFSGMCPASPQTRCLIADLIAETCDVFDGPDLHVGLDEVNIGGHPLTREALRTRSRGDLLADYAVFLDEIVTSHGRRTWMWADGVLKHREMLDRVPRGVLMCDWQYTPDATPDGTQRLLDAGFDVLACSALISHDQPLFPGEQFALPNVRTMQGMTTLSGRGRVLGHVNTVWTPVRYLADSLWLGLDLAAAILRNGADTNDHAAACRFGKDFYGLSADAAECFAGVGRLLFAHAPLRDEWLRVAALRPLAAGGVCRVATLAAEWDHARATLAFVAAGVRCHRTEFDAFALVVRVLAHTYDTAARVADGPLTPEDFGRLLARGRDVTDRVRDAWDRERYADDPRKFVAPVASFQDDHLIPLLESGLATLADHARASTPSGERPVVNTCAATGVALATPLAV